MVIVGINASHNATCCVLIDGEITACISEERLTGVKNQSGLPYLATREALSISGLSPQDVDLLTLSFKDPKINSGFAALPQIREEIFKQKFVSFSLSEVLWGVKEYFLINIPKSRKLYNPIVSTFYKFFVDPSKQHQVLKLIESKMEISAKRVIGVDHHTAHAYSALFSAPLYWEKEMLVLTLDAMGDGVCATVNIAKEGRLKRIATTTAGNSIGDLYAFVTAYLGMKMGDHEYKVMGMAPYANKGEVDRVYQKIKDLIWVNDDLTFRTKIHSHVLYKILPKLFAYQRFDNIAGAIQKLTEELITQWVSLAIRKTNVRDIACAGGVFMNVKANQKILELPEVESLFVMPSSGDESTAIGAAYWGYEEARKKEKSLPRIEPLGNLYLGSEFSEKEIKKTLQEKLYRKFKIEIKKNIEKTVARLLSQGKVVARFSGRMEWGARALGNRSILAHPAKLAVVREINEQIKSRDFWMPFAPSILKERQNKYIVNPKDIETPYMIITFDSTNQAQVEFAAAMHQYDCTLRPQIVDKAWNFSYWRILKEFEKISGIGGVLNTSFNLHGHPIVCSPRDALEVFRKSGLRYLALGPYLVTKKE